MLRTYYEYNNYKNNKYGTILVLSCAANKNKQKIIR